MNAISERFQLELIQRSAAETAARSLEVLNAIEQTIDALHWVSERTNADAHFFATGADRLRNAEPSTYLDADDKFSDSLEVLRQTVENVYKKFINKRTAAISAPELNPDDGVVEAYTDAIEGLGHLHDSISDLRFAMAIHDSQLDQPTGVSTSNISELITRLRS